MSINLFIHRLFIYVLLSTYFLHVLLFQHSDIKTNPGPAKEKIKNLCCCHWNANSLIAHNLTKISHLEAYNAIYKHDFIYISETFFNSSVTEGDKNIQLNGYSLIWADHPSNTKWGGVCIFYKEALAVSIVNSLNFNECIVCEVSIHNSKGYIGVMYSSYSLASPEECKLMRVFVQNNLSQFAVRSHGEWSCIQQGNNSQISYLFFLILISLANSFCIFDDGI